MNTASLPARYLAMALVDGALRVLQAIERPMPALAPGQLRLRVHACGVCRTDLHIVDGELPEIGRAHV